MTSGPGTRIKDSFFFSTMIDSNVIFGMKTGLRVLRFSANARRPRLLLGLALLDGLLAIDAPSLQVISI
jgi:hypothetical protein